MGGGVGWELKFVKKITSLGMRWHYHVQHDVIFLAKLHKNVFPPPFILSYQMGH